MGAGGTSFGGTGDGYSVLACGVGMGVRRGTESQRSLSLVTGKSDSHHSVSEANLKGQAI